MIKVRVLELAALSLASVAGCAADPSISDTTASGTADQTEANAGTGNLSLYSYQLDYRSTSGGDEFLRVGERLDVATDLAGLLDKLPIHPSTDAALIASLRADPSLLKLTLKLSYTKADESRVGESLPFLPWAPGNGGVQVARSPQFVIPAGVKAMNIEIAAAFTKSGLPVAVDVLGGAVAHDFVVFGAFAPNKLALFDTLGADRRTRVVEGGAIIQGAHAVLSVTDWRLDTVVDKGSLDRRYGQQQSGNRFGPSIVDALGAVEYEVTAEVSTDGGASYHEVSLTKVVNAAVFGRPQPSRYAVQTELPIPANAGPSLKVAFHVKAFLQVPSYSEGDVKNARYAPNQRVLLRDVWDNNGGRDYALPIASGQ